MMLLEAGLRLLLGWLLGNVVVAVIDVPVRRRGHRTVPVLLEAPVIDLLAATVLLHLLGCALPVRAAMGVRPVTAIGIRE